MRDKDNSEYLPVSDDGRADFVDDRYSGFDREDRLVIFDEKDPNCWIESTEYYSRGSIR